MTRVADLVSSCVQFSSAFSNATTAYTPGVREWSRGAFPALSMDGDYF